MKQQLYAKQVADLEALALEEGITLPWPAEAIARLEATGAVVDLHTGAIYPGEADVAYRWEWTDKARARMWSGLLMLALLIGLAGAPTVVQAATGMGVIVHIFDDANANGVLDVGEPGLAGVPLTLIALSDDQVTGQVTMETDANGNVDFGTLAPGLYGLAYGAGNYGLIGFTVEMDSPGQQIVIGQYGPANTAATTPRLWLPLVSR